MTIKIPQRILFPLTRYTLFIVLFLMLCNSANAAQFTIKEQHIENTSGHLKLEWESDNAQTFELHQADNANFTEPKVVYKGADRASFISGLASGTYYFRIKSDTSDWSEPLQVEVQHQSLSLAFTLFGLGALVFLLTVFVVVKGNKQTQD